MRSLVRMFASGTAPTRAVTTSAMPEHPLLVSIMTLPEAAPRAEPAALPRGFGCAVAVVLA